VVRDCSLFTEDVGMLLRSCLLYHVCMSSAYRV